MSGLCITVENDGGIKILLTGFHIGTYTPLFRLKRLRKVSSIDGCMSIRICEKFVDLSIIYCLTRFL